MLERYSTALTLLLSSVSLSFQNAHAIELWDQAAQHLIHLRDTNQAPVLANEPWNRRLLTTPTPLFNNLQHADTILLPAVDNGLFANVLQLADAALFIDHHRDAPAADTNNRTIVVDWTRRETQSHFTYGPVGTDVFDYLFEPTDKVLSHFDVLSKNLRPIDVSNRAEFVNRLNPMLLAPSRAVYYTAPFFSAHRKAYYESMMRHIKPRQFLLDKIIALNRQFRERVPAGGGGRLIGLHCRQVSDSMQTAQFVPVLSCADPKLLDELASHVGEDDILFLASDASDAPVALAERFGDRVVLQPSVVRAEAGGEVHTSGENSIEDAERALIDVGILATADLLLCNSGSNVVLAAAFRNPNVEVRQLGVEAARVRAQDAAAERMQASEAAGRLPHVLRYSAPPATSMELARASGRKWTLVVADGFEVQEEVAAHATSLLKDSSEALIVMSRERLGELIPNVEAVKRGHIDPRTALVIDTGVLCDFLGKSEGDIGAAIRLGLGQLRVSMSYENVVAVEPAWEVAVEAAGAAESAGAAEAAGEPLRRRLRTELFEPRVASLVAALHANASYERYTHIIKADAATASAFRALMPPSFLLGEAAPSHQTRNRLQLTTEQRSAGMAALRGKFGHGVKFYRGTFSSEVYPEGVRPDGSFGPDVAKLAMAGNMTAVWQWAHKWSPAAAAMADALASAFHRRVSVNMYVTGAGVETSVSAHNDPHCFIIAQLRGFKRWQIWHHPKYMLTGVTHYFGQHLPRKEQGFGLSGEAIFEGSEELSALGPPDEVLELRPGDLMLSDDELGNAMREELALLVQSLEGPALKKYVEGAREAFKLAHMSVLRSEEQGAIDPSVMDAFPSELA